MRVRRLLVALTTLALIAPASAFARGDFDPTTEFEQHEWIPIHLGPLNLSVTKAVAYLMLGTVCTIAFGLVFMRSKVGRTPGRRETVGELIYDLAQTQIAAQGGSLRARLPRHKPHPSAASVRENRCHKRWYAPDRCSLSGRRSLLPAPAVCSSGSRQRALPWAR